MVNFGIGLVPASRVVLSIEYESFSENALGFVNVRDITNCIYVEPYPFIFYYIVLFICGWFAVKLRAPVLLYTKDVHI